MRKKSAAILLAAKDGARFLPELMESIIAQDDTGMTLKVFFHDDGSSDDTVSIFCGYKEKNDDGFIILDGPAQGGAKENFFYLMRNVEADYYFFADDDDVWRHDKLKRLIGRMTEIEDEEGDTVPVAVFSDMTVVDGNLDMISDSFLSYMGRNGNYTAYTEILIDNPAAGCSMGINRVLRDRAICCEDIGAVEMHDVWVMMLAAVFGKIGYIDDTLVSYRQHGDNVLGAATETAIDKIIRNLRSIVDGSAYNEKRHFYDAKRALAREIIKLDGVPQDKKEVLFTFSSMNEGRRMGRLRRIAFCRKNKIRRARHNIWMLLWI